MLLAERPRPTHTGTLADGSRTITIHDVPTSETPADDDVPELSSHPRPVLRLRGGPRSEQRVAWEEGVIDNENAGKKKSKSTYTFVADLPRALLKPTNRPDCLVCCIYHKPKRFDESSDESSDESGDDGRARSASVRKPRHDHNHDHNHAHGDSHCGSPSEGVSATRSEGAVVTELERPPSPNAYEV